MLKKSGHLNSENKLTDRTEMHLKHWQFMKGTEYICLSFHMGKNHEETQPNIHNLWQRVLPAVITKIRRNSWTLYR